LATFLSQVASQIRQRNKSTYSTCNYTALRKTCKVFHPKENETNSKKKIKFLL